MGLKKLSYAMCLAGVAALWTGTAATAGAQGLIMDARTEYKFEWPVELPGVTLPAGRYVFRFVDVNTGKKVLQVSSNDRSHTIYGLFVMSVTQRPEPGDQAELRLFETPAGAVHALRSWWYPGDSKGREFIYPKEEAKRLAQITHTPVLTENGQYVSPEDVPAATLQNVSATGQASE